MQIVQETNIQEYPLLSRGKVRDIYEVDQDRLLIVTTDRMSAFDVVLPDPIPYKGAVLNQLTIFWMQRFQDLVQNHLLESDPQNYPQPLQKHIQELQGRSVLVSRAKPLPVECIVRGYLSGSGWKDYQSTGQLCGYSLPEGLRESDQLPAPLFTPSTKAEAGAHDENITLEEAQNTVGRETMDKVQELSLRLYQQGCELAEDKGLIIADTKFEFGLKDNQILLIDEVLTPDSSRFWPRDRYQPGQAQPSFDKQYLRDWLSQNWDKTSEPPRLPQEVIQETSNKYLQAYRLLTGQTL
ncbi:MAG: phosphoribosylaminoimidazolesuccinocarboxamide synthase [Desulfohalobiaceae bacterium]